MKYVEPETNTIVHGDCLEVMRSMPAESVGLVVTSPPYNLMNSNGSKSPSITWQRAPLANGYENHDDAMPHEEYVEWQRSCLREMYRLLSDDGAIWYNHKWRVKKGVWQDRADIVQDVPVRQIVIWSRPGSLMQCAKQFMPPSYEVIYLIAKSGFRITKNARKWTDVWYMNPDRGNEHPASFPLELPGRCIACTDNDGLIFDPFMGSGTTAIAADKCGREWIGIEKSAKYVEMANKRIADHKGQLKLAI